MTCLNDFDFRDFLSYVLDQSESIDMHIEKCF